MGEAPLAQRNPCWSRTFPLLTGGRLRLQPAYQRPQMANSCYWLLAAASTEKVERPFAIEMRRVRTH